MACRLWYAGVKVLVCGGRDYRDYKVVFDILDEEHKVRAFTHVIHGAYRGVDMIADRWALQRGVQPVQCPANWNYYGASAGPTRNTMMLALGPNYFVAFPGGRGTADIVDKLVSAGIAGRQIHR